MFYTFFPPKNHTVYEVTWKHFAERGWPQITIWRMRIAHWILRATDTQTLTIRNTRCSISATIVARTRLNVALYVHCLFCLF